MFFTFTLSAAIDSAHALSNVALAALCYTCTTETNEPTLHSSDYYFNRTDCWGINNSPQDLPRRKGGAGTPLQSTNSTGRPREIQVAVQRCTVSLCEHEHARNTT